MSTTRDPRVNHQEGDRLSMDGDVYVVTRRTASFVESFGPEATEGVTCSRYRHTAAVLLVASREVQS